MDKWKSLKGITSNFDSIKFEATRVNEAHADFLTYGVIGTMWKLCFFSLSGWKKYSSTVSVNREIHILNWYGRRIVTDTKLEKIESKVSQNSETNFREQLMF